MPVVDDVMRQPTGAGYFSFSLDGSLVYLAGDAREVMQRLVWSADGNVTASGIAEPLIEEPRLAPDGRRIAFAIRTATSDIWTRHSEGGTPSRLTFEGDNFAPVWTRDGTGLAFSSNRNGPCQIFAQALDAAEPSLLVSGNHDLVPGSWSPDGSGLLFTEYNPERGAGIWVCAPSSGVAPRALVRSRANTFAPAFAPDGRCFAYASDETGQLEVFVAAFPDGGGKAQLSVGGGSEPVWSADGLRLFYRSGSRIFAVAMDSANRRAIGERVCVADGPYQPGAMTGLPNYGVAPAGRLLLVAQSSAVVNPDQLSVTVHWFADLVNRLV